MLRAMLIGLAIGVCLGGPSLIFFRRQIVAGWKEVFGVVPEGTAGAISAPLSAAKRFRRPIGVVILLTVVMLASGLVAIGPGDPLTVALAAAVCLVNALILGLHILATSAASAERQPNAAG